ncbi:CHAP domain-containing protein [Anaeromyxobacter oryzae]|uniref:Peptidase C51 domain-containing protein n=1 Tax=Anaeromyxobacter oryzae TaxID=2918170 RepID=A0ABN6N3Z1_9BACT|nr:CHAP domain-containing protein [Anaeromyxobacter oryzae]BDG06659.1 hypothetical protein AMOR_56550 [Anaeromyxobacter oryzae]
MSPPRTSLLALALLAAGCASGTRAARGNPLPPPAPARAGTRNPGAGPATGSRPVQARAPHDVAVRRALDTAAHLVGAREIVVGGVAYGDGCAALVRASLDAGGAPVAADADARALLALARTAGTLRRTRPAPGDLAFLAERPGGPAEHVGLVESVSPDGTALLLHRTERGVARIRVNAAQAWKTRAEGGRALNDLLVVGGGRLPAGRLLVGYATLL